MQIKQTVLSFVIVLSLVAGCADDGRNHAGAKSGNAGTNAASESDGATSPNVAADSTPALLLSDPLHGTVKETMDSGGYTYVLVAGDHGEVWAAARRFVVTVGDEVELAGLQLMRDFRSQSLNRVFEEIQFVGLAKVIGDGDTTNKAEALAPNRDLPPGHPPLAGDGEMPGVAEVQTPTRDLPPDQIEKLADGVTVAELFVNKADFAGKTVKLRGQVVRASRKILGSNWLHIQDGTGEPGTDDITVTSKKDFAPVGSIVVIQGTLGVNRDFGAGYSYDVIIEDATVVLDRGYLDEEGHAPGSPADEP